MRLIRLSGWTCDYMYLVNRHQRIYCLLVFTESQRFASSRGPHADQKVDEHERADISMPDEGEFHGLDVSRSRPPGSDPHHRIVSGSDLGGRGDLGFRSIEHGRYSSISRLWNTETLNSPTPYSRARCPVSMGLRLRCVSSHSRAAR